MAKISDIYDALYTAVGSALTGHAELENPVDVEQNNALSLRKGYGISFGPAVLMDDRFASCLFAVRRTVTISNTLEIYGHDVNKTIRKTAEKALLGNQEALVKAIEANGELTGLVNNMRFSSDDGIEYIYSEQKNYVMMKTTVDFEYHDSMT